jgi:acetolactate synthase-1/2/3 large subunit
MACDNCDLLVAVGCRFSDRVALDPESFAAQAKIVQIDIDRAEIDKNVKTAHHIIGDAARVLELLSGIVEEKHNNRWKEFVFSYPVRVEYEDKPGQLTPQQVLETIRQNVPGDSIVATDVGQHQMWTIQHFNFDYPGQLLTSGGFGTMGFGLGAALGAKLGSPDKTVLHITGDGCFRMNGQELATESHYDIPVITFVFDNRTLGMVRQWQNLIYHQRYSQTDLGFAPDFVKLAEANGLKGRRVTSVPELESAIHEALAWGHGYVVDCMIDTDEMVRPMVGGGQPITNFMLI